MNRSDELRRFEQSLRALDQALNQAPAQPELVPPLHHSIMRAVRAAECSVAPRHQHSILRWLPATALVALTVLGLWYALRQPALAPVRTPVQNAQPLVAAATALEMGDLMARTIPSAVLSPLSDEWERVSRDMNNTAQFLLASLP